MSEWLGVVVSGGQFNAVHLSIDGTNAEVNNQFTWKLQTGNESEAYAAIYERVKDYVANNSIQHVVQNLGGQIFILDRGKRKRGKFWGPLT